MTITSIQWKLGFKITDYTIHWFADQENHCKSETECSKSKICLEFKQLDSNFKKYKSALS